MEGLPARIFLHELYGSRFFRPETDSFSGLQSFNDEFLESAEERSFNVTANMSTVIIPITGDLIYKENRIRQTTEVNVGQLLVVDCPSSLRFTIINPFKDQEINFLLLKIENQRISGDTSMFIHDFEFDLAVNELLEITKKCPYKISIGQFDGRSETEYLLDGSSFFCFALSGAFEINGRLLHPKDALALWDTGKVELEALSNNAVLVAIELPYIRV